ncbi:hypothetical protein QL285_038819 [Trifolium repens]|nr:hypothetical protein QL285_038819 [Trifolium repens]
MGNLKVLRLLDLTNCNELNVISDNVLIRLSHLEELYFMMDNFPWKKNEVAIKDLKMISHQLKVVEMKFWQNEMLVKDLDFNSLQKFWVYMHPYTNFQRSAYLESNILQISTMDYEYIKSTMMISQLIKKCEILAIRMELSVATEITDLTNKVNGEKLSNAKLFSSNWMKQFPKLETILLEFCISLEVVFDLEGYLKSSGQAQDLLFPQLTKIEISYLKNHSYVWSTAPHCVKGFQNLRFLTISNCDSLEYVFTSTIVSAITNLEKLEVRSCALIKNIVVWNKDEIISFNKLYDLSLSRLPKQVNICSDSLWLECPSLMKFEIEDCPLMEIYFIPRNIDAIHDNLNIMNSTNTKDVAFQSSKENNLRSSGCMQFIPKL